MKVNSAMNTAMAAKTQNNKKQVKRNDVAVQNHQMNQAPQNKNLGNKLHKIA